MSDERPKLQNERVLADMAKPGGKRLSADEFGAEMTKPGGPDEMAFVLRGQDPRPEAGFSIDGVEAIAEQFKRFVLARSLAYYNREGHMPKDLRAIVKLDWIAPADEWLEQGPRPWYAANDPYEGLEPPVEGQHREPRGKP
jgi:hypothetical protein